MEIKGVVIVPVEDMSFTVRSATYVDYIRSMEWMKAQGFEDNETGHIALGGYMLIQRISEWEGPTIKGEPAECSEENKLSLFGQHPELLQGLMDGLKEAEGKETKNSETSQDG